MMKSYSFVTLLWAVPTLMAIGLLLSLYRTFNGTPLALADWSRFMGLECNPSALDDRGPTQSEINETRR